MVMATGKAADTVTVSVPSRLPLPAHQDAEPDEFPVSLCEEHG